MILASPPLLHFMPLMHYKHPGLRSRHHPDKYTFSLKNRLIQFFGRRFAMLVLLAILLAVCMLISLSTLRRVIMHPELEHIVSEVQADQSTQQDNSGSTAAPVEYADGTTLEFINFRCKKCNTAYAGYLLQPTPWVADSKGSCGGGHDDCAY